VAREVNFVLAGGVVSGNGKVVVFSVVKTDDVQRCENGREDLGVL